MKWVKTLMVMVCSWCLVVALFCVLCDLEGGPGTTVYADGSTGEIVEGNAHAGLLGIVSSMENLHSYGQSLTNISVSRPGETVLVGTKTINRYAADRKTFSKGASKAGELGYDALQAVAENQMSYNDYYTLLQIVEAEATGGDVESKLMIANVVLNRVADSHFPDTIYEVVWQNISGTAQFSPTSDGRIYSVSITKSTIEAVERALQGEDNSQGALFFVARSYATASNLSWFDSKLVRLFEYGGHEFYTFREYCEAEAGTEAEEAAADDTSEVSEEA